MTLDLFDEAAGSVERIDVPGGQMSYRRRIDLGRPPEDLMSRLIGQVDWRSESIVLWGKSVMQPRLVAWYGDPGCSYGYSGIRLEPMPWSPEIRRVRRIVSDICGVGFNSVLLNYYRDHRDSMGEHSDDEPELGPRPTIASLSLGAERTFVLRHRHDKSVRSLRLLLASGSLLVMSGTTQNNWKHGLPKRKDECGPRVNLTFRRIL